MITLITGASGSGKSLFAEQYIHKKRKAEQKLVYIATMKPYGKETEEKINRHKIQRQGKEFQTIECYENIETITVPTKNSCVLLECLSNVLANEMYSETVGNRDDAIVVQKIYQGILQLEKKCEHLVIVTNEIFSEELPDWEDSAIYTRNLGILNQMLAKYAQNVYEVVAGIPLLQKNMSPSAIQEEQGEMMLEKKIVVLGGAFQGKTQWAKEHWQIQEEECLDLKESSFDKESRSFDQLKLISHMEKMVEWYCKKEAKEDEISQQEIENCWFKIEKLWKNGNNPILIVDEIGYGMVPMEKTARKYRELTGRMTCKLAEQADEVYRVIAGIPQRLK